MNRITVQNAVAELYGAMLAHDIAGLDDLLSDDAVYVHSTGLVEAKSAFLQGVRDGLYEYEQVEPLSERILCAGDLAVVYTVLNFRGGPRGQPHALVRLITTLVWRMQDGKWRLVLRQATR
jgi:ketosteroid isomerase-like protein